MQRRGVADATQQLLGRGDIRSLWVGPLAGAHDGVLRVVLVYALRFEGGTTDFLLLSFDLETMLDDACGLRPSTTISKSRSTESPDGRSGGGRHPARWRGRPDLR